jgi:heme exporter protein A
LRFKAIMPKPFMLMTNIDSSSSAAYGDQFRLIGEGLAVRRGGLVVAAGIDFSLEPGDALVLKGGNGVGKTSLLRGLAGFSPLCEGQFSALEADTGNMIDIDWLRAIQTLFLGHNNGLYLNLTLQETINSWADMAATPAEIVQKALAFWGLPHLSSISVSKLSAGQKRRLALVRLSLRDCPLWLLDEPSAGLDSEGLSRLTEFVARHRRRGGIIIQTAHDGFVAKGAKTLVLEQPSPRPKNSEAAL